MQARDVNKETKIALCCAFALETTKMCSFKEAGEMLLLSHDMNVISDEELRLFLEENTSRNLEFSYGLY